MKKVMVTPCIILNTFAGMRQSLLKTFDTIYVVNLHGSSRKREGVDDYLFDTDMRKVAMGSYKLNPPLIKLVLWIYS